MKSFEESGLVEPILRAVRAEGYHTPTGIQAAAIPVILEGRDVLGCAQTGTGKTAAFALPTLDRLFRDPRPKARKIRTLIMSPTRELASQICESFRTYGRETPIRATAIYGGVGQGPQERVLRNGVDVLIATPGRLLDLAGQRLVDLSHVQILILDEADRMLDMGFVPDLKRIVALLPKERQTLFFSATMPSAVREMAQAWLRDPVDVRIAPRTQQQAQIEQSIYMVAKNQKLSLLQHWLRETAWTRTLVFARTKHGADKIAKQLVKSGIEADTMHGNKSQAQRQRALARFKSQQPPVLVATDVAARGLDVDNVSHVINFDMPIDAETYVHRIGRTGRSEASGVAISFCDREERSQLKDIERLIKRQLPLEKMPAGLESTHHAQRDEQQRAGQRPQQQFAQAESQSPDDSSRDHERVAGGPRSEQGSQPNRRRGKKARRFNQGGQQSGHHPRKPGQGARQGSAQPAAAASSGKKPARRKRYTQRLSG